MNQKLLLGLALLGGKPALSLSPADSKLSYEIECLDCEAHPNDGIGGSNFRGGLETAPYVGGIEDLLDFDTIVRVGREIWKVVEANRPVANMKDAEASALPGGDLNWMSLTDWKVPQSRSFQMTYRNLYRVPVVTFNYRVQFTPGGRYKGRGAYLARVTVVSERLTVVSGYTFDAEGGVPSIVNLGTEIDPVAGAEVQLKWRVRTIFQDSRQEASYFVDGRGGFRQLSSH